jgi:DNA-binding sugar fermentation-stimulating protein
VFTPDQRDLVLKTMAEMYPEVESKAEKADKEFSRRMREINKNGVKVVSHRDKESPHVKRVRKPKGKPN